jgi:hypothetical protein
VPCGRHDRRPSGWPFTSSSASRSPATSHSGTHPGGAKQAQTVKDDAGSDQLVDWAHRCWTRHIDSEETYVGPVVADTGVWVGKDVVAAKRLYRQQADPNATMPEREYDANGPFAWVIREGPRISDFSDEGAGASAGRHNACDEPGNVFTYRGVAMRVDRCVATDLPVRPRLVTLLTTQR